MGPDPAIVQSTASSSPSSGTRNLDRKHTVADAHAAPPPMKKPKVNVPAPVGDPGAVPKPRMRKVRSDKGKEENE